MKEEKLNTIGEFLGLRKVEVEQLKLVINQIETEGIVTQDTLRRGLGEILPGAYNAMADACKMNIAELFHAINDKKIKSNILESFVNHYLKMLGK